MIRLLPAIHINNAELSLQHPITLNGSIVSKITETEDTYIIRNLRSESQRYHKEVLRDIAQARLDDYVRNFGTLYYDGFDSYRIAYDNFDAYIRYLIHYQIYALHSEERNEFLLDCYNQLYIQNRITGREWSQYQEYFRRRYGLTISRMIEETANRKHTYYPAEELSPIHFTSSSASSTRGQCIQREQHIQRGLRQVTTRADDWCTSRDILESLYTDRSNSNNSNYQEYIHSFNYIPQEYIKHYMNDEDPSFTLLLGVEIEVGGNDKVTSVKDKSEHVKKCIQIMNGSESTDENLIYSTRDSTVQIELDTMPCSLEYHKQKMNYKKLFKYLDEIGYKGHDCQTAGLHIHANRDYLGSSKLVQQLTISKILYILEKFNDEICVIARRNCSYSPFVGKKQEEDSAVELYGKYKDAGKHVALNLKHPDTIEFRMFKSTLKYEIFILTLEFVKSIIDFAKSINIEEIETITWENLMDHSSTVVKDYYKQRKQLEIAKERKSDKETIAKVVDMIRKSVSSLNKELKHCKNHFAKDSIRKQINEKQKLLKEILGGKHSMQFINDYYDKHKPKEPLVSESFILDNNNDARVFYVADCSSLNECRTIQNISTAHFAQPIDTRESYTM